ncbi:MAG TPA: riboflavin synthase [Methylomirabilota bacterium]|nr:riboflavin synthase [Methylomirabilota bacterium]
MFTGLIEELGQVVSRQGPRLAVGARTVLEDAAVGVSIAVNGVCLTVVERRAGQFGVDLGPETLARTTLGELAPGDAVNLERPLRLGGPMGGHLVQGHVDGVGLVADMTREGETGRLRIEWQDAALQALLIPQGSVAVDGVSLTVASLGDRAFEIMVIPHTMAVTTLGALKAGRRVNLEMDMIGKYVQRILSLQGDRP